VKARRIGPHRYQLPACATDFLTADVICTLLTKTAQKPSHSRPSDIFIAIIPKDIWVNSLLNRIKSLSIDVEEYRRIQRLAIGYSEQLSLIDGVLDLSNCLALIEYAELHNCIADDDMGLMISEQIVRLEVAASEVQP